MAFGIDDIVESALGPWGIALGLGVTALLASRRRVLPLAVAGLESGRGGVKALGSTRAGALVARARAVDVGRTGQAVLLGVTRSWTELYAEAKAEFEASLPAHSRAGEATGERTEDIVASPTRGRDARGRFLKRT